MNISYINTLLLFFLLQSISFGQAVEMNLSQFTPVDGLSHSFVRQTFRDSEGFVWFATDYGVNKYDGSSFQLFSKEKDGLGSNSIYKLLEDADSTLWVFSREHKSSFKIKEYINLIDKKTGAVTKPSLFGGTSELSLDNLSTYYQAAPNIIYLRTIDGHIWEVKKGKQFKYITQIKGRVNDLFRIEDRFFVLCETSKEYYILEYLLDGELVGKQKISNYGEGLLFKGVFNSLDNKYALYSLPEVVENKQLRFFSLEYDVQGALSWALDTILLDVSEEIIAQVRASEVTVQCTESSMLLYSENCCLLFGRDGRLIKNLTSQIASSIYRVNTDSYNNIWISTTVNGAFLISVERASFSVLNFDNALLKNKKVNLLHQFGKDTLLLGIDKKRLIFDIKRNKIEVLEEDPLLSKIRRQHSSYDGKGLWIYGKDSLNSPMVEFFDLRTRESTFYKIERQKLSAKLSATTVPLPISLLDLGDGQVFLGTTAGLFFADTQNKVFKFIEKGGGILKNSVINVIRRDKQYSDLLWLGTNNGLFKYDFKTNQLVEEYFNNQNNQDYLLPINSIVDLQQVDDSPYWWIATNANGLIRFNTRTLETESYTVADGLSDNHIASMFMFKYGAVWVANKFGLSSIKVSNDSNTVLNYFKLDGVDILPFSDGLVTKGDDGQVFFGGKGGIAVFDEKPYTRVSRHKPLVVLSCIRYGYATAQEDLTEHYKSNPEKPIRIGVSHNAIEVKVALLDYHKQPYREYRYHIEGFDTEWKYTKDQRIRINRIKPGSYVLKIMGVNSKHNFSQNIVAINLEITPVIYQRQEVYIGILLIFFAVIVAFRVVVRRRTRAYKEAKEEAEASSEAKANFLSTMSHEIRTPMHAVINLTNLLIDDNKTTKQKPTLDLLKFSATHLLELINNILDFNKVDSSNIVLEKVPFDLLELFRKVYNSTLHLVEIEGRSYHLEINHENSSIWVLSDPYRLTQILTNLINNAIKFTEKGFIRIVVDVLEESAEEVRITVSIIDTGIGIAPEKQKIIFQDFTQAYSDTTRRFGGTGLGLSITKKLLDLFASSIQLKSLLGKGADFSFDLKLIKTKKREVVEKSNFILSPDIPSFKVLVVEDNKVNVVLIKRFLAKWGIKSDVAEDGIEALERIDSQEYELILMDINMPRMDGFEASKCIRLKTGSYFKNIPIIAVTALSFEIDKSKLILHGIDEIISKPFEPENLKELLLKHYDWRATV